MGLGERPTNRITTRERPTNRITTRERPTNIITTWERPTNRITTRDDDGWTYSECMKYACSYPDMSAKVHAHMLAPAAHASTYYDPYLFKAHAHAFTHRVRMIAMCVYDCSHCGKPKRERKSKKRTRTFKGQPVDEKGPPRLPLKDAEHPTIWAIAITARLSNSTRRPSHFLVWPISPVLCSKNTECSSQLGQEKAVLARIVEDCVRRPATGRR